MQKSILLFTDWYEPGFKAGGPIRSCSNFVNQMKEAYQIYVLTTDRDLNDNEPYSGIAADTWIEQENGVKIYYCSPAKLNWKDLHSRINEVEADFIYLNSMFSRFFTIYPLLMNKFNNYKGKVVLSPRGMLKQSALQFKSPKKKVFLSLFKTLGLHKKVHFHATDDTEQEDIARRFGTAVSSSMIPNFPAYVGNYPGSIEKSKGELKMIFIGRLHPIKNLDFLLKLLPEARRNISLTIIGNEEYAAYVEDCKKIIAAYPPNIQVVFEGEIPNQQLPARLAQHHIFVSPTRGENFGHAIFEALKAGRPVLISDQTPWKGLQSLKVGWDLPLGNPQAFIEAIQQAADLDQEGFGEWSYAAWKHVHDFVTQTDLKAAYNKLFS
ncbi:glycosyltransferase [Pseudoflavitalea sp. G-6-1-2]|uniref:glycosyltransferase n=1 Tax=Pseudoflavitalea sp. G-6-1-2 TaxID=2728841 RepID=UPI00146BE431|nr:glycosyltransferase [Pseudoflavitalea sp. G-6-1-2]